MSTRSRISRSPTRTITRGRRTRDLSTRKIPAVVDTTPIHYQGKKLKSDDIENIQISPGRRKDLTQKTAAAVEEEEVVLPKTRRNKVHVEKKEEPPSQDKKEEKQSQSPPSQDTKEEKQSQSPPSQDTKEKPSLQDTKEEPPSKDKKEEKQHQPPLPSRDTKEKPSTRDKKEEKQHQPPPSRDTKEKPSTRDKKEERQRQPPSSQDTKEEPSIQDTKEERQHQPPPSQDTKEEPPSQDTKEETKPRIFRSPQRRKVSKEKNVEKTHVKNLKLEKEFQARKTQQLQRKEREQANKTEKRVEKEEKPKTKDHVAGGVLHDEGTHLRHVQEEKIMIHGKRYIKRTTRRYQKKKMFRNRQIPNFESMTEPERVSQRAYNRIKLGHFVKTLGLLEKEIPNEEKQEDFTYMHKFFISLEDKIRIIEEAHAGMKNEKMLWSMLGFMTNFVVPEASLDSHFARLERNVGKKELDYLLQAEQRVRSQRPVSPGEKIQNDIMNNIGMVAGLIIITKITSGPVARVATEMFTRLFRVVDSTAEQMTKKKTTPQKKKKNRPQPVTPPNR